MSTANVGRSARTFLFVPADRLDRLGKAFDSGADAVIIDLEDAVAPERKDAARAALSHEWGLLGSGQRARLLVRVNGADSPWWEQDLAFASALAGVAGVVVPKAERPASLQRLAAICPRLAILPMVESAEGLQALDLLARVPGVVRLAFGNLDFQADLGMECGSDETELQPARMAIVVASRRACLAAPVDGVTVDFHGSEQLEADVRRSRRSGFGGKLCIHPRQVELADRLLRPTDEQRTWAARVIEAAAAHGDGAFQLDGRMVDAPVLLRARSYLAG